MRSALATLVAVACLTACAAQTKPDNAAVCGLYTAQQSRQEVVMDGTVAEVLGIRGGRNGEHEGFLLKLDGGCDLLVKVETNVSITGAFPLRRNDRLTVKGEYEYTPMGGVVHWTHHDPRNRHESGFVEAGGRVYQ